MNRVPNKTIPKTPFELWTNKTPSIRHLHIWSCQAEIKIYNLQEIKLDERIISGYFIGYPKKSKKYMFYYPNHNMRIVETENIRFIENGKINRSTVPRDVEIKKKNKVQVPLACASSSKVTSLLVIVQNNNEKQQHNNELMIHNKPIAKEPQEVALRRSHKKKINYFE